MLPQRSPFLDCPSEVLLLILEELDDTGDLSSLSRTCKSLRQRLLPNLLRTVDLSSHNAGRLPEQEDEFRPEVHADFDDYCRPLNLVTRQRAFLRFITHRSDLAHLVESFTWTLIWRDFDEESLTEIDYELWNVFSRLTNVRHLDLASIHEISDEPFMRKNPPRLFPAVTDLRLLGWMHRGLVNAILNSLDPTALRTVCLDYLQDEGSFPNGDPMAQDVAIAYGRCGRDFGHSTDYRDRISEELYERQRRDLACVFPGPMWTALRTLSRRRCTSLTKFELKIPAFSRDIDMRNYFTCFHETANFLMTVSQTLASLTIVFGESWIIYYNSACASARTKHSILHQQNILVTASLLRVLLPIFSRTDFPSLTSIVFQGLHILDTDTSREMRHSPVNEIRELVEDCPLLSWETVIGEAKVDHHPTFCGHDYPTDANWVQQFRESLERS